MLKGDIDIISVATVIQLCYQEKKSGCLSLYNGKTKIGEIFLKNGQIIAAHMGNVKGEKAFYKLISLKKGEFLFENNVSFPEQEINLPYDYLFLEAVRQQDETKNYLESIEKKLAGKASKVEEEFFFEEIYLLFSKIGQLLEGGKVECLWAKDNDYFSLFLETNRGIIKISLLPHAVLEELIFQIKEIVKES